MPFNDTPSGRSTRSAGIGFRLSGLVPVRRSIASATLRASARGEIPTATRAASAAAGSASQAPASTTRTGEPSHPVTCRTGDVPATKPLVAEMRARYAPAGTSASSVSANAPFAPTVVSPTLDPRRALATLDRDHGSRQSGSHGPAKRGRIDRSRARELDARRDLDEQAQATRRPRPRAGSASCERAARRRSRSRSCRTSPPFRRTTTSRPATTRAAVCRGSGRSRTAAPPSRRRPCRSTVGRGGCTPTVIQVERSPSAVRTSEDGHGLGARCRVRARESAASRTA